MANLTGKVLSSVLGILIFCLSAGAQTPSNGPVSYVYDELGRLIAVLDAAGNAAVYNYDAVGNILSIQRYTSSQASIISFSPDHGTVGDTVTITGTGFSSMPAQNTVAFNGVAATVISSNSTQIVVSVPTGATSGPISATTPSGNATSVKPFSVLAHSLTPSISSFTPNVGVPGSSVTVSGSNFDPVPLNNRIRFNIASATTNTASVTGLTVTVPPTAMSGHISLSTPTGMTTSSDDFFVPFGTHTAADVGFTGRVTIGGTSTNMALSSPGKIGLLVFDAAAGQRVGFQWTSTLSVCSIFLFAPNGASLPISSSCQSGSTGIGNVLIPSSGTYTIGVDGGSSTGTLNLQLIDVSDVIGSITIDGPPVTITTTNPDQDARLEFDGTAGQRVVVKITGVTNPSATALFLGITGEPLYSLGISSSPSGFVYFMDTVPLLATGRYTLWLEHAFSYFGGATFQVNSVPPDFSGSITGGATIRVPATGNTAIGQNAALTFTASAGQRFSVSSGNGTYSSCMMYFKDSAGANLSSAGCAGPSGYMDTVTFNTAGTYGIFIDPQGMATGNISATLNDDSDVSSSISIDGVPITVTTTNLGQDARLNFTATAGQRVVLRVTSVTNPSATVYLLKPDGTTQANFSIANSPAGQLFFMDTQTLASSGTYTIWVQHNQTNVGSETLQLNSVPADYSAALTLGTPAQVPPTGNLSIGQNVNLTFSGTAGLQADMQFSSNTVATANVTLLNPDGSTLTRMTASSQTNFSVFAMLPTTGVYTIVVDPVGPASGSFSILVALVGGPTPPPTRNQGSVVNPGSPLSQRLVGLFLMNEGTGTTDKNVVSGQTASLSGTNLPVWNTSDPSVLLRGTTTSLSSYLDAGTDLSFDQLPTNKVTVVAKVFLSSVSQGGIAEKTNDSNSGFTFGLDGTGALNLYVLKTSTPMRVATTAGAVTSGQWVQVAFTWDGTLGTASAGHIYVNGVEQAKAVTQDGTGTLGYAGASNSSFRIGNNSYSSFTLGSLNGKVAYLAVYKYRVLTPTELNQLDAQLPVTTDVVGTTIENGTTTTVTTTTAGQNAHVSFQGWTNQQVTVQLSNNTMGSVTVNLVAPDGSTAATTSSSASSFSLPVATLPLTGTYDVFVQGPAAPGSITVGVITNRGGRASGSVVDPSNPLSANLAGLFLMNEGTGTTDKNIVDGQLGTFSSGVTPAIPPIWNTTDPSAVFRGTTTSLSSYLDAGTDLNFDQLPTNKMTVVAKVFLNSVSQGGIAEKNNGNNSGFTFGLDSTGALNLFVLKSSSAMRVATAAGAVSSGQWVQVAFTWDGTVGTASAGHIYVNGVEQTKLVALDGSGTLGYAGATNSSFRIGNSSYSTVTPGSLNGNVAYFAVYKYRALTPTELNQLDAQLPITRDVVGTTTENGTATTMITTTAGQNAHVSFQGWANQQVTVQLSSNSMGQVTVNLVAPDGSTAATTSSSASSFSLPMTTLPLTGTYDVFVQGAATPGSITVSIITNTGGRASGSVVDPSNPLSTNLVGLFLMNEGTGTTDKNIVDAQTATLSGTALPIWNTSDPSVVLRGTTTSLTSYLDAGTDLNFDQMPTNKMTVVAKVFLNSVTQGGIIEKNDGNISAGFLFGVDSTGALVGEVIKSASDMRVATGANAIASGQWVQVAFTWDGTVNAASAAHIYVNGTEQTKVSAANGSGTLTYTGATNKSLRIGNASFDTVAGSLNGKVAYVAVYRGRILTNLELNQLDIQLPIH